MQLAKGEIFLDYKSFTIYFPEVFSIVFTSFLGSLELVTGMIVLAEGSSDNYEIS